jgi:hypothetical protein
VRPARFPASRSACRTHFPEGYRLEPLTREQFAEAFGEQAAELLQFCEPYAPSFGLAGHPERFRPGGHARGEFWVCIFLSGPPALYRSALDACLRAPSEIRCAGAEINARVAPASFATPDPSLPAFKAIRWRDGLHLSRPRSQSGAAVGNSGF